MAPLPPPGSTSLDALSDADLRRLLSPYTTSAGPALTFTNWATTFRSTTQAVFRPTEVEHVRWAVELARREGKELRAAGAGHSPSDIVCTDGYVLDLKGLKRVLDVDGANQTLHAEGGILLRDLHPVIRAEGDLALSCLGSISDQTLAGAISTSTHGSGVTYGSLSSCATFLDIVLPLPGAPVVRCSRTQDKDLFLSALCGIGAVGVVVGVGLRAERAFKLEEECFSMRFDEFRARWQEIAESSEHVRCWWFPQVGRVKISRLNRTKKPVTPPPSALATYTSQVLLANHVHALALTFSRIFPSILPYHAWFMWTFVHQPGPVRWLSFLRGLVGGVWKKGEGLRVEEVDEADSIPPPSVAGKATEKANTPAAFDSPTDSSPSSISSLPTQNKATASLAVPPADLLTPPLTPPVTSRTSSGLLSIPSSPPRASSQVRQPSSLAFELEKLGDADFEEKEGVEVVSKEEKRTLPWPILENEPTVRVGWSVDIFNYDCGFPQYTYESCVPYSSTGAALSALNEWQVSALWEKGYPLRAHFPIEIRWTEKDDVYLSPTSGQRGCYLGAIQYRPFNLPVPYRSAFTRFSSLLSRYSGRPHWAKSHHLSPSALRALYPNFDAFLSVRERVDPQGVLVNSYVRRHLLGTEGQGDGMEGSVRRWKERA
ncbi:hypothetical protein JCM10213_003105 [Rhodosporidiobolus nylandii]